MQVNSDLQNNKLNSMSEYESRLSHFEQKIDDLEQKSYSNVIVCTGDSVKEISDNNPNNIQSSIVSVIQKTVPDLKNSDIVKVTRMGRNNTHFKVHCINLSIKRRILKEARIKKPINVFYYEYLTRFRNQLFYEARKLRKSVPDKIAAVYVRDGTVFCKLNGAQDYKSLQNIQQLHALLSSGDSTD